MDIDVAYIVSRFGGQSALSRRLGCPKQSVHNWILRKAIPKGHINWLMKLGRDLNPPLSNDEWDGRKRLILTWIDPSVQHAEYNVNKSSQNDSDDNPNFAGDPS